MKDSKPTNSTGFILEEAVRAPLHASCPPKRTFWEETENACCHEGTKGEGIRTRPPRSEASL